MKVNRFLGQDLQERSATSSVELAGSISDAGAPSSVSTTVSVAEFGAATSQSPGKNSPISRTTKSTTDPLSERLGPSSMPQPPVSNPNKHNFVLLCVRRGTKLRHAQIDTTRYANDDEFFEEFRREYRRLRGFWRYWLHPRQFSFCHFSKFTRYYVDRVAKVRNELPNVREYEYIPRPPDVPYVPPIPPEEWYDRYYSLHNTQGIKEAIPKIPRRDKRFQLTTHVSGREDMWGLHVEFSPSLVVIVLWQIAISVVGWMFLTWWLTKHHGDWQDAGVPATLILTALVVFWSPLSGKFRDPVSAD